MLTNLVTIISVVLLGISTFAALVIVAAIAGERLTAWMLRRWD